MINAFTLAIIASVASATSFPSSNPLTIAKWHNGTVGTLKSFDSTGGATPLAYSGGLVIENVEVYVIYWGGSSQVQYSGSQLEGFYNAITDSAWYNILSQYSTNGMTIGAGSFVGSYSYDGGATGIVQDSDIQTVLSGLISAGTIPAPNKNTYHAIHFAPGITITQQGANSCQAGGFCGYHGTIVNPNDSSFDYYYGILPDQGGGCQGGCGTSSDNFANLCSVASHELGEMVTDPQVGLATPIISWYNQAQGEIGDICNGQQSTTVGRDGKTYTVQLMYSNADGSCVNALAGTPFTPVPVPVTKTTKTVRPKTTTAKKGTTTSAKSHTTTKTTTKRRTTKTTTTTTVDPTSTTDTPPEPTQDPSPPADTCAHDICTSGAPLDQNCDPCVAQIYASDPYCSQTKWSYICVNEVYSICGLDTCGCQDNC